MNNNNVWGPAAWTFLHTITFNYPDNPTNQDKQYYFNFKVRHGKFRLTFD